MLAFCQIASSSPIKRVLFTLNPNEEILWGEYISNVKLTVKNSYLLCEGNTSKPYLLKSLTNYNFFVCDFDNKDYFWLDEICI